MFFQLVTFVGYDSYLNWLVPECLGYCICSVSVCRFASGLHLVCIWFVSSFLVLSCIYVNLKCFVFLDNFGRRFVLPAVQDQW